MERARRITGAVIVLVLAGGLAWHFSPGLPVLWGPHASAAQKEAGGALFEHEWQVNDPLAHGDGIGPVFNARSCVACHFQGGVGGGGTVAHNVTSFEAMPTQQRPDVTAGILHACATNASCMESQAGLRQLFPIIKGSTRTETRDHCSYQVTIPDFDPLRTDSVNSTALFGAGWIDRISTKAITSNRVRLAFENSMREFQLDFHTIPPGRPRILPDGRVGRFGWKAQHATLKEFVAAACANEIGLGNPLMEQARPLSRPNAGQATPDLDDKQFSDLVAFVDTLPRPVEILPDDPTKHDAAARGKELFGGIGCAVCHTPDLGGVKGVYTDLMLHTVDGGQGPDAPGGGGSYRQPQQNPPVPPPADHPQPSEWKTPALWGVADSAPYFHDGGSPTLRDAILRHGGDAGIVTAAYRKLPAADQEALVAFLQTLKAPPDAKPAPPQPALARGR
jgi:cytochrome c peroxidase